MTISEFEHSIGVSNGYVNSISKSIGIDKLETIVEKYSNINLEWLLTGKGFMLKNGSGAEVTHIGRPLHGLHENQSIPLYELEATAGIVALFKDQDHQKPIAHLTIPNLPKCDGAVYVTGDSMYPLLKSGDIVIYKTVHDIMNGIFWGEMYLLSIEDYVTVKYVQKSELDGCVKLVSYNKHHQDKDVEIDKIRALALVKASVRINSM
ncbi:MAG: S24 family peptidase [Flavobacteriales bacterium]|nr:S24 family peptidase [Flavobacteriales bacterium]